MKMKVGLQRFSPFLSGQKTVDLHVHSNALNMWFSSGQKIVNVCVNAPMIDERIFCGI